MMGIPMIYCCNSWEHTGQRTDMPRWMPFLSHSGLLYPAVVFLFPPCSLIDIIELTYQQGAFGPTGCDYYCRVRECASQFAYYNSMCG